MRTIWKYQLSMPRINDFEIPMLPVSGYPDIVCNFKLQFLKFDIQDSTPTFWAVVDTNAPKRKVRIHIIGTGWDVGKVDLDAYIGTIQEENGLVWHYFYEIL